MNAHLTCFVPRRKYFTTLITMISLAVYYSLYATMIIATFNPKGDLVAYRAMQEEQPTLKCDCEVQSIPIKDFAVPTVAVNRACEWVKADLAAKTSSCRVLGRAGYCVTVRDACLQSEATINWILEDFNNSVVSSTSLIQEAPLNISTQASYMGNFRVGELMASGPKLTISAWASANMPRIMKMNGDIAIRVKALTKKQELTSDSDFWQKCAAAKPIICYGNSTPGFDYYDYDYTLTGGGKEPFMNCIRDDDAVPCSYHKVANGYCNKECMSDECLFDGGDCAGEQITTDNPMDLRQSFTLFEAQMDPDQWTGRSWLDTTPSRYLLSTRLRCDDAERWAETKTLARTQELQESRFEGFNYSILTELYLNISKTDSNFPKRADGTPIEFFAAKTLGCDEYLKQLKGNMFEFYSVDEFRHFLGKMRELGESAVSNDPDTEIEIGKFRSLTDPSDLKYVDIGYFNYLENFAAPIFESHTNLDTAIDNLFVDYKSLEVDYENYFIACKVSSCTYAYKSASTLAGIAAVLIGLMGGIITATSAMFTVVYHVMRGVIVPYLNEADTKETEGEGSETPATEGAQASKSSV